MGDALQGQSESPAIDWNVLEAFRAHSGEEMLRLLIDTYLSHAAEKLDQLAKLANDRTAVGEAIRLAHSLKSGSAMAGAAALSQLAARVEKALTQDAAQISESEVLQMKSHFANYRAVLVDRRMAV